MFLFVLKERDMGKKMKLKHLQRWRFKVFIMLKRKHLKFLHLVEVQTFLGAPHLPQVAVCIVCFQRLWLENVSFCVRATRILLALLNPPAGPGGEAPRAGGESPVLSLLFGRTLPSCDPALPSGELITTLPIHLVQFFGNCDV